jgi:flagellar biosynthesis/type III secretory pathway M-ring protein FliF/YscJ
LPRQRAARSGSSRAAGDDSEPAIGASSEAQKPGLPDLDPAINIEQYEEVVAENARLVKENPAQAALLIRYWLNDGKL